MKISKIASDLLVCVLFASVSLLGAAPAAGQAPVGYAWQAGQTKQVVYMTTDNHIHELSVVKGGSWKYSDVTASSIPPLAPLGLTNMIAYDWPTGGTKQIIVPHSVDPNNPGSDNYYIGELYSAGGAWKYADLNALTGAPAAHGGNTAFAWQAGGTKQVVYGSYNHIIELSVSKNGAWHYADLTQFAAAPPLISTYALAGFEWNGLKEVAYVDGGHIHELYVGVGGAWQHADLTALTGCPPAGQAQLLGYSWSTGGTKQIVFFTYDRHIHELYVSKGHSWKHADLTQLTGSPIISDDQYQISAFSWDANGSKHIIYVGVGGHIHELYATLAAGWKHTDLTTLTGAPLPSRDVSGYWWPAGGTIQIAYFGNDQDIHELYKKKGGSWTHADLTQITKSPKPF